MSSVKYPFTDDDGNIYELSFEQMIEAKDGFFETDDGKILRRVRGNTVRVRKAERQRTEIISDAMGFSYLQLPEMRQHLKDSGCRGVEFIKDKNEPTFMQVKCDSPQSWQRYMKARGMFDKNSKNGSGAMLSEKDFEDAKELVLRNQ